MRQPIALGWLVIALLVPGVARATPNDAASSSRASRITLEATSSLAATFAAVGVGIGAGLQTAERCAGSNPEFGRGVACSVRGSSVLIGLSVGLLPPALLASTYLPHRARGGRGRWWSPFIGAGAGLGAGVATLSTALEVGDGSRAAGIAGTLAGGLLAAAVPVVAVEWSHSRRLRLGRQASERRRQVVSPVASALPSGGAWIGLAGTL